MKRMSAVFLAITCFATTAHGAKVHQDVPATPDPSAKYLFYFPGLAVELQGPDAVNPYFRKKYEFTAITKVFVEKGYEVIAEVRPKGTKTSDYAKKVSDQVRKLTSAGVPPSNIVLVGHSKGGEIVVGGAGVISSAAISYVVLAGCAMPHMKHIAGETPRPNYEGFMNTYKGQFKGRLLSLYDHNDNDFRTCSELGADNPELKIDEQMLKSDSAPGMGHAVFFAPDPIWMDPVLQWLAK